MGKLIKKTYRIAGFVLLDVLIALIIASISFIVVLANITYAGKNAALMKERLFSLIAERNVYENEREIRFSKE